MAGRIGQEGTRSECSRMTGLFLSLPPAEPFGVVCSVEAATSVVHSQVMVCHEERNGSSSESDNCLPMPAGISQRHESRKQKIREKGKKGKSNERKEEGKK